MMLVISFNNFQTLHCTSISKLQLFSNFTLIQKIVPHQKDCKLVHMIFHFHKNDFRSLNLYKWPVYINKLTSSALKSCTSIPLTSLKKLTFMYMHYNYILLNFTGEVLLLLLVLLLVTNPLKWVIFHYYVYRKLKISMEWQSNDIIFLVPFGSPD